MNAVAPIEKIAPSVADEVKEATKASIAPALGALIGYNAAGAASSLAGSLTGLLISQVADSLRIRDRASDFYFRKLYQFHIGHPKPGFLANQDASFYRKASRLVTPK